MALLACAECRGQVSDLAQSCPHCGAPQTTKDARPLDSSDNPSAKIGASVICVVLLACGLLLASHLFSKKEPTAAERADAVVTQLRENPVTRAKYDQIPIGALPQEVEQLIGMPGEELSRVAIGKTETVMYAWKNKDGSNMNATFQDGGLVSKAQFGLR